MLFRASRLQFLASILLAAALPFLAFAQSASANPKLPTLFVVGDLPAASLTPIFDATHINVSSSPAAGRTTRAYINSGDWESLLTHVKPGDFILMEFASATAAPADKATSISQGTGDATFDYLNPGTQKIELVHSYGWYLRRMIVDTINHGASPILCSPPATVQTAAISPDAAEPAEAQSTAAAWSKAIATEQRIPFLDLTSSGDTITPEALKSALFTLQPDPLSPYLKH